MFVDLLELVGSATLSLPALEVSMLFMALTFCLVLRFTKVGLVTAYVFVYRWGWLFFAERSQSFLISYLVLGMVVGVLTVIGMMREGASEN
jgi:hypothetical protein